MRSKTRKNRPSRPGRNAGISGTDCRNTPGRDKPQHTASERDTIETGLRILARIIVRTHLLRQVPRAASASPLDQEAGY